MVADVDLVAAGRVAEVGGFLLAIGVDAEHHLASMLRDDLVEMEAGEGVLPAGGVGCEVRFQQEQRFRVGSQDERVDRAVELPVFDRS